MSKDEIKTKIRDHLIEISRLELQKQERFEIQVLKKGLTRAEIRDLSFQIHTAKKQIRQERLKISMLNKKITPIPEYLTPKKGYGGQQ